MKKTINKIILITVHAALSIYKKLNKDSFNARIWSNNELKKTAHLFTGDIINVSAGKDKDKQNAYYSDYFKNKSSYTITNYVSTGVPNEIILDLEKDLPENLRKKYDVVFSHTVLEHIYDTDKAVKNLCHLSKNIVITVVPFLQTYHHEEDIYYDFWRFSPLALIKKFNEHNFKTLYISWNNDAFGSLYIFHIASCKPKNQHNIKELYNNNFTEDAPGMNRTKLLTSLKNKTVRNKIKTLKNFISE